MPWIQLIFEASDRECARLESALQAAGALAVTLQDAAHDPVLEPAPGAAPLWTRTRVVGLFDVQANVERIREKLCAELHVHDLPPHELEALEDRVWAREWLVGARPLRFGSRLWICPGDTSPPRADTAGRPPIIVRLDPGLAFGAGTHPSTALCLEWLAGHELRGAQLIDYGCGSGILAIAALKLGARHALAIDHDPQACEATRANADLNGVAHALTVTRTPPAAASVFDVLLANIVAGALIELANRFAALLKPGGRLVLAGVLDSQRQAVADAYGTWFDIGATRRREEWICIEAERRL